MNRILLLQLLWITACGNTTERWELSMIDVDGTDLRRLTETGNATRPVWSPTGSRIAYEWNIHGNEVYLYEVSSGRINNIETGLEFAGGGMWNSDGTKLLVSGRKTEGAQPEMRLLDIEATPLRSCKK